MSQIVLAKVLLAPAFIALATLAGRRWGARMAGLIAGLPLTSGPVSFFLAVENGAHFAATAAVGTIAGLAAFVAFVWAYAAVVRHSRHQVWALAAALGGYGLMAAALGVAPQITRAVGAWLPPEIPIPALAAVVAGCGGLLLVILGLERRRRNALLFAVPGLVLLVLSSLVERPFAAAVAFAALAAILTAALRSFPARAIFRAPGAHPWWDVPLRMGAAAAMVLVLTSAAAALGPSLTGLLSPFPVFITVMATFTHRHEGPGPTLELLRGALVSTLGFAAFFVAIAELAPRGLTLAFAVAIGAALAVDALVLVVERAQTRASSAAA